MLKQTTKRISSVRPLPFRGFHILVASCFFLVLTVKALHFIIENASVKAIQGCRLDSDSFPTRT